MKLKIKNMNYEKFIEDIDKFGFTVLMLETTDYLPSFAYTVGLWKKYKHPEVISFGLSVQNLQTLLNTVSELVKEGKVMEQKRTYEDFFDKGKVEFIKVDERNIQDYFGMAIDFYNSRNFQTFQLVWADRNNKFPWETNFEENLKYRQPLLDRNADFKFREAENLGIFTTRQWLELGKPILKVIHDNDGDWQFLTGDSMPEDGKLISLKEMVKSDKTLNEVFDLDYGEEAEREFIGGKWIRSQTEKNDNE
jgi:hypothetical protein